MVSAHAIIRRYISLFFSTNAPFFHQRRLQFIDRESNVNISAQSLIASLTSTAPYSSDLEELQNILHFPEEVALRLTDAEYQLYYQVP